MSRAEKPEGHVPTALTFDWPGAPTDELLAFILANQRNKHNSGAYGIDKDKVPGVFKDHASSILERVGYEFDPAQWRYWIGIQRHDSVGRKPEFAHGFPHSHSWDGLTVVHYVQVAESGGALVILEDDNETLIHRFEPVVGMSSVIDGWTVHGVERLGGKVDRLVMIATGFKPK